MVGVNVPCCCVGLQLTTLLLLSTVDAQRFYAKLHLVAQLITLDPIEKSNLVQNLQASTVETYNEVVSYRISSRIIKQCMYSQHSRAVYNQERIMMVCIKYMSPTYTVQLLVIDWGTIQFQTFKLQTHFERVEEPCQR